MNHAFSWTEDGGLVELPTLGGHETSATDINASGVVAGSSSIAAGYDHAFTWTESDGIVDLGEGPTEPQTFATAINDDGMIAGSGYDRNSAQHALVWLPRSSTSPPGAPGKPVVAGGSGQATVTWAPADGNGSQIGSYTVIAQPGSHFVITRDASTTALISGLTDGTTYTFTVSAHTAAGDGPSSPPSDPFTPRDGAFGSSGTVTDQNGGTVSTSDGQATGYTTSVGVPAGTGGGTVDVTIDPNVTETPPAGYTFLDRQITIDSTANTDATHPLTITFEVGSLPSPATYADIAITRTEGNGTPQVVPACPAGDPPDLSSLSPPVCVRDRQPLNTDGTGAKISVLTASASTWNLAIAPVGITVRDAGYSPPTATAALGRGVLWTFTGTKVHSVTDAARLGSSGKRLFDSGAKTTGTFTRAFADAGTYVYRSSVRGDSMTGSICVPVIAGPSSGTRSSVFTLRWATGSLPAGYVEDVQMRFKPTGSNTWKAWSTWKSNQTGATATFTATKTGAYQFQARLRNKSTGSTSGYSPAGSITVS
jgi:probable HAF family extracellular repeat protein